MTEEVPKTTIEVTRKTPLILTAIIMEALKMYFKQLKVYLYSDIITERKIEIEPSFQWTPKSTENRPGLYVKRGAIQYRSRGRVGTGDIYGFVPQDNGKSIEYGSFGKCNITVFCISSLPGEAEKVAEFASDMLISYAPIIKHDFKLMDIYLSIGELSQIEESKEFYVVPISVNVEFNETWKLEQDSLKIKILTVEHSVETKLKEQLSEDN